MYAKDGSSIVDRRELLRVKLKSLAEEARIIRAEERRTNGVLRCELWRHRTNDVRSEARHTHIAYGLIRGRGIERMECPELWGDAKHAPEPDWKRVRAMVKRYGPASGSFVEPDCMRGK